MKKLIKILSLILILILSTNCRSPNIRDPKFILDTKQCAIIFNKENLELSKCICRDYRYSYDYMGKTSDAHEVNLFECDAMVGYPDYTLGIATFFQRVLNEIRGVNK